MIKSHNKNPYAVLIAAIAVTLVIITAGLATGLACAVQKHNDPLYKSNGAKYLLIDSADSLRRSVSALRLCTEKEPAEQISRTALVFAVRAEAALECSGYDWLDARDKEAFLNDISVVLHSDPSEAMRLSDEMFKHADNFYRSVVGGDVFEYGGLDPAEPEPEKPRPPATEQQIEKAQALVASTLDCGAQFVGEWEGHIEFNLTRGDRTGYAVVCDDKIVEYSFTRGDNATAPDEDSARRIALEAARACGYDGLQVKWIGNTGRSVSVVMCRSYDGALACDDYATAVVCDGEAVAFNAGTCDCEHTDVPKPRVSEAKARVNAAKTGIDRENGTLVVHKVNGRDRICYEYVFVLEDGVHYSYVCAETGKQIQVT